MLKIPIGSEEHVEAVSRQPQQIAVFFAAPADGSHGSDLVIGEQYGERSWQGLIEKDAHRRATAPWRRPLGRPLPALASRMESGRETRRANLLRQGSRQGSLEGPACHETRASRLKCSGHCE